MFRRLTIALALLLQGLAYAETRDLILVAGQSNAVGFDAYAEELPADPKDAATMFWWRVGDPPPDEFDGTSARQWTTLQFQPRTPAMQGEAAKKVGRQYGNFNKKSKGGFGPEIGMVRTLATKESRPLAVIKTAFSGTSVAADWNVGLPGKADACPGSAFVFFIGMAGSQQFFGGGEMSVTPGVEWRTRAISAFTLWPGS